MKKAIILIAAFAIVAITGINAHAVDATATTAVTATVSQVFSLELTKGSALNFSNVDSGDAYVEPDGHVAGTSDAEIICRTNAGIQWGLKVYASSLSAGMTSDNLLVYVPANAFDRNKASGSNAIAGGMKQSNGWHNVWTSATEVYRDYNATGAFNTTPNGTLLSFNYALCPTGTFVDGGTTLGGGHQLGAGSHNATLTYTMTTTLTGP